MYLGHIISDEGVAVDMEKVDVMLKWPAPHSLKQLCGFLGLTRYYRRFVENYGSIPWPLIELLRKDNFHWGPKAEVSFQALKQAMTQIPVLTLCDFSKTCILETNASGTCIGAVLMQDQRPLSFFRQALPHSARLKSVYERELIDVVGVVQK